MSRVNALAVLDSQIAELRASGDTGNVANLLEVRDLLAALLAFASSFSIRVVDNYYQDAYLHIDFPKGDKHPHGKAITYRLPAPSSMSPDLAEIELLRTNAITRCGRQP